MKRLLWVLLACLSLSLPIAGCGASQTTYTSADHGFTFSYDDSRFKLTENPTTDAATAGQGENPFGEDEAVIALVDQQSPKTSGNIGGTIYVDVVTAPFDLSGASDTWLRDYALLMRTTFTTSITSGDVVRDKLSGRDAWAFESVGKRATDEPESTTVELYAVEGPRLYRVSLIATTETWAQEEPALREAAAGFTIAPPASPAPAATAEAYENADHGFSFTLPAGVRMLGEEKLSKTEYQVWFVDTTTSPLIGVYVDVYPGATRTSNAASADIDYSGVVAELRKAGYTKISAPRVVRHNGLTAWQWEYTQPSAEGLPASRFRTIDFWNGKTVCSITLRARPDSAAADFASLKSITQTFAL